MRMAENDRPELTDDEKAEKIRLRAIIEKRKSVWEQNHPQAGRLTQARLGELIGELRGDAPLTQGAIYHYINPNSHTKLNPGIVQAIAFILGFDVEEVSPRFKPKPYTMPAPSDIDSAIASELARLPLSAKRQFLAQIAAVANSIEE